MEIRGSRESSVRKLRPDGPPRERAGRSQPTAPKSGSVILYASRPVVTVAGTTPLRSAIETMNARGFRRMPVLEDGKVVGMVTMRSILRYFGRPDGWLLEDVLALPVTRLSFSDFGAASPSMMLAEAADLMRDRDVGALLVTGPQFDLLGIFTERDVFDIVAKTYL